MYRSILTQGGDYTRARVTGGHLRSGYPRSIAMSVARANAPAVSRPRGPVPLGVRSSPNAHRVHSMSQVQSRCPRTCRMCSRTGRCRAQASPPAGLWDQKLSARSGRPGAGQESRSSGSERGQWTARRSRWSRQCLKSGQANGSWSPWFNFKAWEHSACRPLGSEPAFVFPESWDSSTAQRVASSTSCLSGASFRARLPQP